MAVTGYRLGNAAAEVTKPAAAILKRVGIDALRPMAGLRHANAIAEPRNA